MNSIFSNSFISSVLTQIKSQKIIRNFLFWNLWFKFEILFYYFFFFTNLIIFSFFLISFSVRLKWNFNNCFLNLNFLILCHFFLNSKVMSKNWIFIAFKNVRKIFQNTQKMKIQKKNTEPRNKKYIRQNAKNK